MRLVCFGFGPQPTWRVVGDPSSINRVDEHTPRVVISRTRESEHVERGFAHVGVRVASALLAHLGWDGWE